jgi:hypothetical protein
MLDPSPLHGLHRQKVGPHEIVIELPDILHIRYHGDVELEHFKIFDATVLRLSQSVPIYILRDAREGGNPSSETRSYIAKNVDVSRIIALVTYGSSFQARTIATMLNKAMRRLHEETGVSVFFDTESEARVWIDEHRKQREGRYGDAEKP